MNGELAAWAGDLIEAVVGTPAAIVALRVLRRRNVNSWLQLLEDSGRLTSGDLDRAFQSRPAAAELFATALDAAARTQQAERHRLLAGLVVAGLADEHADVDTLLLLEQVAERLTDAHIRLLLVAEATPQELIEGTLGGPVGITDELLAKLWPQATDVVTPLRLGLEREGLLRDVGAGTYDGLAAQRWVVSDFGQRLIDHYRSLGREHR